MAKQDWTRRPMPDVRAQFRGSVEPLVVVHDVMRYDLSILLRLGHNQNAHIPHTAIELARWENDCIIAATLATSRLRVIAFKEGGRHYQ